MNQPPVAGIQQLSSFGCSITFGTDLRDDGRDGAWATASQLTWPALLAQKLGLDYRCWARGGAGNLSVLDRATRQNHSNPQHFLVINWTFIDRFDYSHRQGYHFNSGGGDYETLRPSENRPIDLMYYEHLHSEYRDKLTNLIYINTAIDTLLANGSKFLMTAVDDVLWCKRWHSSPLIEQLQHKIRPYIHDFEGRNFLDWSRHRGFDISDSGHPLELAHETAAELMLPVIDAILRKA